MKVQVLRQCTAQTGENIEPGHYDCIVEQHPDVNEPGGMSATAYILVLPEAPHKIDITNHVKAGTIRPA